MVFEFDDANMPRRDTRSRSKRRRIEPITLRPRLVDRVASTTEKRLRITAGRRKTSPVSVHAGRHVRHAEPITLLLTLISRGFIYDRDKDLTQKILKGVTYVGAMGPPGGF